MTKRAKESRKRIVDAAKALFARDGTRSFTVRECCRFAGVSTRMVYRHFENIDDGMGRGMKQQWIELRERIRGPSARDSLAVTAGMLRGTFNGSVGVLDLAVEVAETKRELVPRLTRRDMYFSAGVVMAAFFHAVHYREEVRRDVDSVVESAVNFVRTGLGMVPRSIESMERAVSIARSA